MEWKHFSLDLSKSTDRFSVVDTIIDQEIPDGPDEVKQIVAAYAQGNPGASRVIARAAKGFTTKEQVEEFVGWPLSEMREGGSEIYTRLKQFCKEV